MPTPLLCAPAPLNKTALGQPVKYLLHGVLGGNAGEFSGDAVGYLGVIGQVIHYRFFWRSHFVVPDFYKHGVVRFADHWWLQAGFFHRIKSSIEPLTDVLVGWIRKLVN